MKEQDAIVYEDAPGIFGGSLMTPLRDPYSVYAKWRGRRPAIPLEGWMDPTHMILRYDDVVAGLKDPETFSSIGNARGIGMVMGRTILEMEGREHLRQRRLVTPFFSMRSLRGVIERSIEEITNELIDGFEKDGHADLVKQYTFTFPLRVVAQIIGVPIADFEEFHHWAADLISIAEDPQKGFEAADKIVDYLRPILEKRAKHPREDLLSALLAAEVEGEKLSEEEVLSFLRLLLPAGAETTYRLTGNLLMALLRHPDQAAEVAADSELLDQALEETLRWESPVQVVSREATREVELQGQRIPKGELILFNLGAANRDDEHFDDPDRFDLHRPNKSDHVSFGFGEHFCLGSHLARLEARMGTTALLSRLPNLRLDPAQTADIVGIAFRSPDHLPVLFG